ncbi:DNA polymerase sigma subunit [Exophiala viscosa]|uniref:DNA polymerase sigma subunit n=1 Tax=Exophiala viscosa TaxID=2486360 RepID=A0AAN6DTM7_9EURO|nr:DNA polymerase sigma subunit [Exophiala viscosa]KAI1619885.1 DNA polymerase sigma subunit [Exophiala viscosa]
MPSVSPLPRAYASLRRCNASTLLHLRSQAVRAAYIHHGNSLAADINHDEGEQSSADAPPLTFPHEPNIDINSLSNTLDAHREANRTSLIRKVDQTGHSKRLGKGNAPGSDPSKIQDVGPARTESESSPQTRTWNDSKKVELLSARSDRYTRRKRRDNQGKYRDVTVLWRVKEDAETLPTRSRLPWMACLAKPQDSTWISAMDRLSAEIRAFGEYSAPSQDEKRAAENALSEIIRTIQLADPNLDVDVIGSRASGFDDPLSDLDLNITNPLSPRAMNKLKTPYEILRFLENAFRGNHRKVHLGACPVEVLINVRHAKVPILICQHRRSGLPVQIQSTPRAFDNTEYVKAFDKEFPTLRSLFKVIKQIMTMRGLNIGSHGGLTSYPLIIMIVAALKFSEGQIDRMDAGKQLLYFLDMYTKIDFTSQGISTRPLRYFPKYLGNNDHRQKPLATEKELAATSAMFEKELAGQRRMGVRDKGDIFLMTLQDPADPFNELGKSVYLIKDIQETLIGIGTKLKASMAEWEEFQSQPRSSQDQYSTQSLLEPCISGDYRTYKQERNDLQLLGREQAAPAKRLK